MNETEPDLKAQERFHRLQQLLLEDDRVRSTEIKEEIENLRRQLVSPAEIQARVSPFIEDKVKYLQENFPELFGPVLSSTIKRQIAESQDEMVDALYPIIGKLIRKFVAKEIEALTERIDQQINQTFSWQAWLRPVQGLVQGRIGKGPHGAGPDACQGRGSLHHRQYHRIACRIVVEKRVGRSRHDRRHAHRHQVICRARLQQRRAGFGDDRV